MKTFNLLSLFIFFSMVVFSSCGSKSEEVKTTSAVASKTDGNKVIEKKRIIFFGNSITAGYQLDPSDAFPALIQLKIDSLKLNYECVNAGNSGETTAGGLNRLEWVLNRGCDVFVLELGANDGLRGLDLVKTEQNLNEIINTVLNKNTKTKVVLCGMKVPPSMGSDYSEKYDDMFRRMGERDDVFFIPFILKGVAGIPELNLEDGIHPTVEGHKILAKTVWNALRDLL